MLQRGTALLLVLPLVAACGGAPTGASGTTIDAYYDNQLFTASYRELDSGDPAAGDVSILYEADAGLASGAAFVSVLSGTSAGPTSIWREIQLSGNQCAGAELCAVPLQLTSVEQILAAVGTGPDQIRLVPTETRCSVLGVRPAALRALAPASY